MDGILGIVPAAGRSSRIGNPKPLLDADGTTFLERAVGTLRSGGLTHILVGIREERGLVHATAVRSGATVVVTSDPEAGPIATVREALARWEEEDRAGERPRAVVVLPVDHPKVRPETVRALVDAFRADGPPVIVPTHRGKEGWPVLFAGPALEALRAGPDADLEVVLERHRDEAHRIEPGDEGVLVDIDTLRDYRRHYARAFRKRFQKW